MEVQFQLLVVLYLQKVNIFNEKSQLALEDWFSYVADVIFCPLESKTKYLLSFHIFHERISLAVIVSFPGYKNTQAALDRTESTVFRERVFV